MKKIKGARWAWWSPAYSRHEMPTMEFHAMSDSRGGNPGKAVPDAVGDTQRSEVFVPPRDHGRLVLMKSKSQGERGDHAAPRRDLTDGAIGPDFSEGRRSASHVEANAAWVASSLHMKVMAADMPEFMQVHAFRCARRSYDDLDKFSSKQMAHDIKKEFDKVYGPVWHCVIGSSFGSFVTHSTGCFLCFSMGKLLVMVFKTRIPRGLQA